MSVAALQRQLATIRGCPFGATSHEPMKGLDVDACHARNNTRPTQPEFFELGRRLASILYGGGAETGPHHRGSEDEPAAAVPHLALRCLRSAGHEDAAQLAECVRASSQLVPGNR